MAFGWFGLNDAIMHACPRQLLYLYPSMFGRGRVFNPMMKSWSSEIEPYAKRLGALPALIDKALTEIDSLGVRAPCEPSESVRAHLLVQLSFFSIGALRVTHDLVAAAEALLRDGKTTSTCLQVRLLFEYWGAMQFVGVLGRRALEANLENADELENVARPINRLIGGSRSPVKLPWGGEAKADSYNVMKFIEQLEKSDPGQSKTYDFLCEACHPSYIQQTYLWMAGSTGDNWSNDNFRTHAHELLEQLTVAGESAAHGLALTTEQFVEVATPFLVNIK